MERRSGNPQRHPKNHSRFISYLSNNSLLVLLLHFTGMVLLVSLLFALADNVRFDRSISWSGFMGYLQAALGNFAHFFGAKIVYPTAILADSAADNFLNVAKSYLRILIQTYALGGLVFKVLAHSKTFEPRKTLCVSPTNMNDLSADPSFKSGKPEKSSGWEIRARFYNASQT